jgi:RNA polymerase sigma-70 factor (ECF subfamily)
VTFGRDPLADPALLIRRVYGYVAYRIGAGPDAEDVTSEVFERAVRYRSSYQTRKGEPAAWLIGIARTRIADRALTPTTAGGDFVESAAADDPTDALARRLDLQTAIARLPERDRELIALRYGADLTAREIARVVGLKTNAVEVALHRALTRLRDQVEEETVDELPVALQAVRI